MSEPVPITATGIARAVAEGTCSATAALEGSLERVRAANDEIGAFLYLDEESAHSQAEEIDRRVRDGEAVGRLAGVPVAVKDNLHVRDMPTTCASRLLEGYVPPDDAHVVELLRAEDAVLLGKTNLDEFAIGSTTEFSARRPTRNPLDPSRVPGGSSGGSAAAVASGMVPVALGSDTGGSIRLPAAWCGLVGFKPTYGTVSRRGLVAFASSLDQVGPLTATVQDAALVASVLSRPDPLDPTCTLREPRDFVPSLRASLEGLRIGVHPDLLGAAVEPSLRAVLDRALDEFREGGARIVHLDDVDLGLRSALATYYVIACSEAASNLARYDGMRYGRREEAEDLRATYERTRGRRLGPEVRRRILAGTFALRRGRRDRYYVRACRARRLLYERFARAFERADVLFGAAAPCHPPRLGESVTDPVAPWRFDALTVPASLAGLPALAMPVGRDGERPVAGQWIGPPGADAQVLAAAFAAERRLRAARDGRRRRR